MVDYNLICQCSTVLFGTEGRNSGHSAVWIICSVQMLMKGSTYYVCKTCILSCFQHWCMFHEVSSHYLFTNCTFSADVKVITEKCWMSKDVYCYNGFELAWLSKNLYKLHKAWLIQIWLNIKTSKNRLRSVWKFSLASKQTAYLAKYTRVRHTMVTFLAPCLSYVLLIIWSLVLSMKYVHTYGRFSIH